MLLKICAPLLVFATFAGFAEEFNHPGVSHSKMVTYTPTCDDDLVKNRRELMQASFVKDGFQLIQGLEPVSLDTIDVIYGKIAAQITDFGGYDFLNELKRATPAPPFLEPLLNYVREAIDRVTRLGFKDERNLVIDSADILVQKVRLESGSEDSYMVKTRQDDGFTVMTVTFKGTPSLVNANGQLFPVPATIPFVYSGERRAAKFPEIEATEHGDPFRLENRFTVVVKLHPSKGGPIRFELVQ
jgi:hypothetical protein